MVDITWNSPAQYARQPHFDKSRMAGSVPVWKTGGEAEQTSKTPSTNSLTETNKQTQAKAPSFSFGEFLDIVNPLHHIPVVSNIYRSFTGDQISSVAQVAGGSLYGGALGGVASLVNAAVQEHSGQSTGAAIRTASRSTSGDISVYEDPRMAGLTNSHEKRGDDNRPRVDIQLSDHSATKQKSHYNFNT